MISTVIKYKYPKESPFSRTLTGFTTLSDHGGAHVNLNTPRTVAQTKEKKAPAQTDPKRIKLHARILCGRATVSTGEYIYIRF